MSKSNYQKIAISEIQAQTYAKNHYGLVGKAKKLPGDADFNFYFKAADGREAILKISRPDFDLANLNLQSALFQHLEKQTTNLIFPRPIASIYGNAFEQIMDEGNEIRIMRLLVWLPGRLWAKVNPHTDDLWQNLGNACGTMMQALRGFDHPNTHRFFKWNSAELPWIEEHLPDFETKEQREMVEYFLQLFESKVTSKKDILRKSAIHGDLNDYNILVSEELKTPTVTSVIDFGDINYSYTINELAIACAYAMMNQPDPLSTAKKMVEGCHEKFPLNPDEIEALFPLIAARLLISVTHSSTSKKLEPENEYLQISAQPAWDLLKKMSAISPNLAHFTFRNACGCPPCLKKETFKNWVKSSNQNFAPVVQFPLEKATQLDLSVGSLDLGHYSSFENDALFTKKINDLLAENDATVGLGGYNEVRPVYTTDAYLVEGNNGPQWRTVHLGLDIWTVAETPVFAPLAGKVFGFSNNDKDRDYGPTIILEHSPTSDLTFYTLYGHLSLYSLNNLKIGQEIEQGQQIASIGAPPENGNWPPHLHFQIMLDMLNLKSDFPGVAYPHERDIWLSICPNPTDLFPDLKPVLKEKLTISKSEILEKRAKNLPKNLSISYQKPLKMVRGVRQYLYDDTGRRYLDTVNNVAHVGHQHPRVTRAARRQMELLNTNTRYLHPEIIAYSEALLATFPSELSVVSFVNSGSEANELALRMAKTITGKTDMLTIEVGYHGSTNACVEVSSYKFDGKGGSGAPPQTHVMPIPDDYRGLYRKNDGDIGEKYAAHLQRKIQELAQKNRGIAGFIAEPILSCGGQIVSPEGYLKAAYQHVRNAGGVCISDEVQVGFGRVGEAFWGFQLQGVVPDIVTLGKPIGNGHPLGAVVCTRAVADAFANGMEYFSTFGGNPASCAIGHEVLKIVQDDNLQEHALTVGNYLMEELKKMRQDFSIIGDVRGKGFFLGFELVKNQKTLEPAAAEATYLINRMRTLGVLMSTDGPLHNVIKIKPPMAFDKGNVDFLIRKLRQVFEEDFLRDIKI